MNLNVETAFEIGDKVVCISPYAIDYVFTITEIGYESNEVFYILNNAVKTFERNLEKYSGATE